MGRRSIHAGFGLGAAALLVAAAIGQIEHGVTVRLLGRVLPPSCSYQMLWGISCPGCGMTRSFILMTRGDLMGALAYHRFGPALFVWLALQVPYHLLLAWRPDWQPRLAGAGRAGVVAVFALFAGMAIDWGLGWLP